MNAQVSRVAFNAIHRTSTNVRMMATVSKSGKKITHRITGLPMDTYAQRWLSDYSTYPIIMISAGAATLALGFLAYKFATDNDVRVSKTCKGHILRDWLPVPDEIQKIWNEVEQKKLAKQAAEKE